MSDKKLTPKLILSNVSSKLVRLKPYAIPGFLIMVGLVYGFLFLKIGLLVNSQPSDTDVSNNVKAAKVPYIDEKLVNQLESLHDNSFSAKALFEQNRTNPFQ